MGKGHFIDDTESDTEEEPEPVSNEPTETEIKEDKERA